MGGKRSREWSFWWVCSHCDRLRLHLVNETPAQPLVWARCGTCSTLLVVTCDHRVARESAGH